MRKFIIEREIPGASELTAEELKNISQTSNKALAEMNVPYHWVESYVAGDKIYCVHVAEEESAILEHARLGGFPVNSVNEIKAIIDSTTADA